MSGPMVESRALPAFDASDALPLLLTTEALLLTAFGISVALTQRVAGGHGPTLARGYLACAVSVAITVAAVGAGAAWWDVYADPWPEGVTSIVQAAAIGVGIAVQPIFGWWVALSVVLDGR